MITLVVVVVLLLLLLSLLLFLPLLLHHKEHLQPGALEDRAAAGQLPAGLCKL